MRKAFNFYKSFYDVYKELNKTDKVEFMDALLMRQFDGIEPTKLKGMAKFAYKSQEQVINQQIQGWETKTGLKITARPTQGGYATPIDTPSLQEEGQGQVQGQGQVEEQEKGEVPDVKTFLTFSEDKSNELELFYEKSKVLVKYQGWVDNGWKDGNGKKIVNWRSKIRNTLPHILRSGNNNEPLKMIMPTL